VAQAFQVNAFQNNAFQVGDACIPAFQASAFQNNAFQVCTDTPPPTPGEAPRRGPFLVNVGEMM
jgi:hypothetical protein